MPSPVYLDYAASAPIKPAVKEAMIEALDKVGNPSSIHAFGRGQRAILDESRATLAKSLGVKPEQVIFTGGATEANNLALSGIPGRRVVVGATEHPSVLQAGAEHIRVTAEGLIDLNHLEQLVKASPALVSIMLVNNETGVIQPVTEAATLIKAHSGLLHVDAVQAFGKIPVNFKDLGADMLSLSGHKLGGPQGVGALILREGLGIEPLLKGGGQEQRRRAGTENVTAIRGLATAFELIPEDLARIPLYDEWQGEMAEIILKTAPEAMIFGQKALRVPTITCIAMPGVKNETQLMAFDLEGYAVSSGSACSSGKVQPSHVLRAMGVSDDLAMSAIRISFGWATVRQDLTGFAQLWSAQFQARKRLKAA